MTTATIDLSPAVNLRDLGGIPIAEGVLRKGLAIRADDLSILDPESARSLVDAGLTSVIDLRSADEVAVTGRGPLAEHPVAYHHLSLMTSIGKGMEKSGNGIALDHAMFGEMYWRMYQDSAPALASALTIIALSPGATAFHCAAGRDRTGVLAASLLLALGADDDAIVADYVRTEANMAAIHARTRNVMGAVMLRLGFDLDAMMGATRGLGVGSEVAMRALLARVRASDPEPLRPLLDAGLSTQTVQMLRDRARSA